MRIRHAASLVEVIVALLVFSVGALGSAAVLASAARAHTVASARRDAVNAMRVQAATLALTPCATLSDGTAMVTGVPVAWTASVADSTAHIVLRATHRATTSRLVTEFQCR